MSRNRPDEPAPGVPTFPPEGEVRTTNPALRSAIYAAFDGACFWTGRPVEVDEMHVDHVVPVAVGGEDNVFNYVLTTAVVNQKKYDHFDAAAATGPLYMIRTVYAPRVMLLMEQYEPTPGDVVSLGASLSTSPLDVKGFRARVGWGQGKLARTLDVDPATVYRWERGDSQPPGYLGLALQKLEEAVGQGSLFDTAA